MKTKKLHRSWYMIVLIAFIMTVGMGMLSSTNSVFMTPVCETLGFSRAQYTLHRTIITLVSALGMSVVAKLLKPLGVRRIFLISTVALCCLTAAYGAATQLWHFYGIALVNGLFTSGMSFFVAGNFVSAWFEDSKGIATAIAYSGSGVGGAIFSPVLASLIESLGWRWTYVCMGAAGLILLLPVLLFLLKDTPAEVGLEPYRQKVHTEKQPGVIQVNAKRDYTFAEAKRSPMLWVLLAGYVGISLCAYGPYTHHIAFFSDNGYSMMEATTISSFYMVMLTVAKFFVGIIFDKFGMKFGSACIMVSSVGFPLLALCVQIPAVPWIYCTLLGFVGAASGLALNLFIAELFGTRDFGAILGLFTTCNTLVGSTSSPLMGAIYDATGSYFWAWIVMLGAGLLGAGSLLVINILMGKQKKQNA